MPSDKRKDDKEPHPDERTRALILLAAHGRKAEGPHPEPGDLAAFVDGRLNPERRLAMMEHIDSCNSCLNAWMTIAAEADRNTAGRGREDGAIRLPQKRFRRVLPAAMLAAACLVLCFYFLFDSFQEPAALVKHAYHTAGTMNVRFDEAEIYALARQPFASGPIYGFSTSGDLPPASRAFLTGWTDGGADLGGGVLEEQWREMIPPPLDGASSQSPAAWQSSSFSHYYWLGKWSILVVAMCGSNEPSATFWKEQQQVPRAFTRYFGKATGSHASARRIVETLEKLTSRTGASTARHCRNSARELQALSQYLAGAPP